MNVKYYNQYISEEEALGNVVNLNVDGKNIITLLNNYLTKRTIIKKVTV